MKEYLRISLRAAAIVAAASSIGLALNLISPRGIPWLYRAPTEVVTPEMKIPLTDEKKAREFLDDARTVFVDARSEEDYLEGHVRGAVSLPDSEKEQRFPDVQAVMPTNARLILYCSGPECDMAEKLALFLGRLGYKDLMIMSAGYPAWKKAGYPVEGSEK